MTTEPRDLIVIPYHSWPKVQAEGGRTRDAHLIEHLAQLPEVRRVAIINRPTSLAEVIARRRPWRTAGPCVKGGMRHNVVQVSDKTTVLDFLSLDPVGPLLMRKYWFAGAFGDSGFVTFVTRTLAELEFATYDCISFNLFAAALVQKLKTRRCLFDGWDNFLSFPEHTAQRIRLRDCYAAWAGMGATWTTNSETNRTFYMSEFGLPDATLIPNGVDVERFKENLDSPAVLVDLPRPIVGIGAKISHLIDTDLMNFLTAEFPRVSFVLAGQILEPQVYHRIERRVNFHFIGDLHYREYPAFVKGCDVCLIPYVPEDRQHGGDAIKFYEYLAADKPIVSTRMAGIDESHEAVFTADCPEAFADALNHALKCSPPRRQIPENMSWRSRARAMWQALHAQN